MPRLRRAVGAKPKRGSTREILAEAPEVERIGTDLINDHHGHLRDADIRFYYTNKAKRQVGKRVLCVPKILSPAEAFMLTGDSTPESGQILRVITDKAAWTALAVERRQAYVDDALYRFGWEDKREKFCMVAPGFAGFPEVIRRHGLYSEDARELVQVLCQGQFNLASTGIEDLMDPASDQEQAAHSAEVVQEVVRRAADAINAELLDDDGVHASATVLD